MNAKIGRLPFVALFIALLAVIGMAGTGPDDFVTGGGFITGTPSGAKGNFGFNAGIRNGITDGELNYVDHGPNMFHFHSVTITSYQVVNPTTRRFMGTGTIDGTATVNFTCTVSDNGEPGRSDTFQLQLSNGYNASGTLVGGNIQLHL